MSEWINGILQGGGGGGGGGGDPTPGANTQVVFNDGGVLGADADFTWDKASNTLVTTGTVKVRQSGGVAGTDELQISHDGTVTQIESKDGNIVLRRPGNVITTFDVGGLVSTSGGASQGFQTPTIGMAFGMLDINNVGFIRWTDSAFATTTRDIWMGRAAAGILQIYGTDATKAIRISEQNITVSPPASGAGNDITISASAGVSGSTNGGSIIVIPGAPAGAGINGRLKVRRSGGLAGIDEIQMYQETTAAHLYAMNTNLRIGSVYVPCEFTTGGGLSCPGGTWSPGYTLTPSNGLTLNSTNVVRWTNSSDPFGTVDTRITRLAAGVVQVEGVLKTNAQYGDITTDTDGATITFNMATSNKHTVMLGDNRTLAVINDQIGQTFMIILTQDAIGGRTVTWWSGISWAGGSPPTLTTTPIKKDFISIIKLGVGSYAGFVIGLNV